MVGGSCLEVAPSGGKWWRFEYRFGGKEKRFSFGVYPDVSLKDAREKRDAFTENLERIMKYIARKGGRVIRHELLTSREIQGNAIDYDRHLAALVDAGYLLEPHTGRRKETTYMIIPSEQPLIEVCAEIEAEEGLTPVHHP